MKDEYKSWVELTCPKCGVVFMVTKETLATIDKSKYLCEICVYYKSEYKDKKPTLEEEKETLKKAIRVELDHLHKEDSMTSDTLKSTHTTTAYVATRRQMK